MPGFNIGSFGGGMPGGPSNVTETRRQNRWYFESLGRGTGTFTAAELLLLESTSRPKLEIQEVEMEHNQETAYFAGKHKWSPIKMRWYDAEQDPDISRGVYAWINTCIDLGKMGVAHPRLYKRSASLRMVDGTGQPNEVWSLIGTWAKDYDGGDLDYSSSKIAMVEVTMRYDRAVRQFMDGSCPVPVPPRPLNPACAVV
jgi:phage tail-like protein